MWKLFIFGFALVTAAKSFRLESKERNINRRATDFGTFDPNALYQQQAHQTQTHLSQASSQSGSSSVAQSSSSGGSISSSSASSGSSSTGGSTGSTGSFDPNALYQQMSQQMQQYIDSHKPSTSGSGSSSSSGSSTGTGSGSSGSTSGSSSSSNSGSSSSSGSGSFDPNALFQQMSQQSQQNLNSQNTNTKYDANTLNKVQASFTDPTKVQLGTSSGGGAGFDPDQYNTMKFNLFNPEQGGQSSSQTGGASQTGSSQTGTATTKP